MKKKIKVAENYLDFIPAKSKDVDWKSTSKGTIQIIIYRNSLLDRMVRKLFSTPDKFTIDLDSMGSFIWKSIDEKRNIHEISLLVKEEFGEKAEPLLERLITYMNILKNNKFISFHKPTP